MQGCTNRWEGLLRETLPYQGCRSTLACCRWLPWEEGHGIASAARGMRRKEETDMDVGASGAPRGESCELQCCHTQESQLWAQVSEPRAASTALPKGWHILTKSQGLLQRHLRYMLARNFTSLLHTLSSFAGTRESAHRQVLHEVPDKAPCEPAGSAAPTAELLLTSFCSTGSSEAALCKTWFSSWFSAFPAELSCRKCAPWSTAICIGCSPRGLPVSLGLRLGAAEPGTGTVLSCPSLRKTKSWKENTEQPKIHDHNPLLLSSGTGLIAVVHMKFGKALFSLKNVLPSEPQLARNARSKKTHECQILTSALLQTGAINPGIKSER